MKKFWIVVNVSGPMTRDYSGNTVYGSYAEAENTARAMAEKRENKFAVMEAMCIAKRQPQPISVYVLPMEEK